MPTSPSLHSDPSPSRDVFTRRKITIYEDPRDEFVDPKVDRFHDNGNYMTRSEITRRFDYGLSDRTPFRTRYRGLWVEVVRETFRFYFEDLHSYS